MKFDPSVFGLALLFALLPASNLAAAAIEFNRAEEGTLYFNLPSEANEQSAQDFAVATLKTDLHDVHLVGKLEAPDGKIPYFAFTAKPCADCSQERSIYFVRPTAAFKPIAVTYPGKLIDPKGQGAVMESRAFLGKCLRSRPRNVFVIFQKEKVDRKKKAQTSVFIAEPGADHLEESLLESRLPNFNDTLRLVKQKACREIDGRNRVIQKKPFEIKTRFKRDEDNDDDEDETQDKEKEKEKAPAES